MTRINLIPPSELSDQHLFSEFREIKMVPKSLARSLFARGLAGVLAIVPPSYTLGKGHVSFFYNKGSYLFQRYAQIQHELWRRDINYDPQSAFDPDHIFWDHPMLCKDYTPTEEALRIIRARIDEKIAMKPTWYRWSLPSKRPAKFLHTI